MPPFLRRSCDFAASRDAARDVLCGPQMILPSSRGAIGIALSVALSACGGKSQGDGAACAHVVAPPITDSARVIRIDTLDLGETRDYVKTSNGSTSTVRAGSYGYDLDGLCSDGKRPESLACRRAPNAIVSAVTDGDGGIDNSFGKLPLMILVTAYAKPSEAMSRFSYLETRSDGTGTLYLGTSNGIHYVIPLVDVRLAPPASGSLGTLAAIAPRDALIASLRSRISLAFGPELCKGSTLESIVESVSQSADIVVSGAPGPERDCDGISIGLQLSGTTVDAVPPLGPDCRAN